MTKRASIIAATLLVVLATGCGGGGGGHATPPLANVNAPANGTVTTGTGAGQATVQLTIPSATTLAALSRAKPQFVSSGTQSVKIAQGSTVLGTFNTTASSPGCVVTTTGLQCTFSIAPTVGANQIFTVTAYSATNAGGSLLSSGQTTATVVAATNTLIAVTMGGQVASLGFTLPTLAAGTAASGQLITLAKDASGATIIGPGSYTAPISVSVAANSGHVQLAVNGGSAGSSIQLNAPSDTATIVYDGGDIGFASLSASTTPPGGTAISQAAYFGPTPTLISAHVSSTFNVNCCYATGSGIDSKTNSFWISVYNNGTGNFSLMQVTASGVATEFATGQLSGNPYAIITNGPNGNLWIANDYNTPISYWSYDPSTQTVTPYTDASNQSCYLYGIAPAASGQAWIYANGYCNDTSQNTIFALDTTSGNVDARMALSQNNLTAGTNGVYLPSNGNLLSFLPVTGTAPALTFGSPSLTGFGQSTLSAPTLAADGSLWDASGCTFTHIVPGSPFSATTATYFLIPASVCTPGQQQGGSLVRRPQAIRRSQSVTSSLAAPPIIAPDGSVWTYGSSGFIAGLPAAVTTATAVYSTADIPVLTAGGQTLPFSPSTAAIDPVTKNLVFMGILQVTGGYEFYTAEVAY